MAFDNPLAGEIWNGKYRFNPRGGGGDDSVEATWDRVAAAWPGSRIGVVPATSSLNSAGATTPIVLPLAMPLPLRTLTLLSALILTPETAVVTGATMPPRREPPRPPAMAGETAKAATVARTYAYFILLLPVFASGPEAIIHV